jgi:tetratricopeptide (TPR) repeat protein
LAGRAGERTLDAVQVTTLADLAAVLRDLRRREARRRDDSPLTYRELAARTGWSYSIISEYFAGTALAPTDRFDVLVRLLGASEAEQRALATARDRVEERRRTASESPPRQLPADVPGFTGRAAELAELDALLRRGSQARAVACAITGPAGVGKTTLAVHWAHRVRDRFPDGQLYVNLRGFDPAGAPTGAADALRSFLSALGVAPDRVPPDPDAQAALYRSLLARRRLLVVLDNARDAAHVRPLLPGAPDCLALITSRDRLTGLVVAGARHIGLAPLSTVDAREMIVRRLGAARVGSDPAAVDTIVASCARLPLAVAVAAARAAARPTLPLAALAAELRGASASPATAPTSTTAQPPGTAQSAVPDPRGSRAVLDALDAGDPATDVRAVFSWSYRALSPDAATLFRLLGLHPGPDFSAAAAASLAGVRKLPLDELARMHLVEEHVPGRYRLHDLLRAYAAELATTDPGRDAATARMVDHYLHTAFAADRLLNPLREPIELDGPAQGVVPEPIADREHAMAWFTAEHPVLIALTAVAGSWRLPWTMANFLHLRGHHHHLAATQETALRAAQAANDRAGQAHAHRILAGALVRLDRPDESRRHLEQAIALLDDSIGRAHIHLNLGSVLGRQGRHAEALDHATRALRLYRDAGLTVWQARSLDAVGWLHAQLGDLERALGYSEQALRLHREVGDRHGEAETWDSLGFAQHRLGHHAEAVGCYRRAIQLYSDLGDRFNQATSTANLGDAHHAAGDPTAARAAWLDALTILDDLNHPDAASLRAKLGQ